MTRPRGLAVAGTVLVAIASLEIGACGRRGSPVAPELRVPAAATELQGLVRAGGIELAWTNPGRRADRTPLRDLTLARVFRSEDDGAGDPRPALARRGEVRGYTEVATIRLAAPAVVAGPRVSTVDARGLQRDRRYTYVVLTEDSRGRASPPSERLSLHFIAPPEPPAHLTAEPGEGEARLAWSPPTRLADGSSLRGQIGYEVLRAAGTQDPLAPLAGPLLSAPRLVDRGLENDRAYGYAVRAVRVDAETRAVSELTPRVSVTPADLTPPSPPAELVAIPSERAVRLSWKPSLEPDVARYVVYRASPRGDFARVGSTTAPGTTFLDREVPGGTWRYVVTAEDTGSRRNESPRSNEVTVSLP